MQLQTTVAALEIFKLAASGGHGHEDFSAITKAFERH
jgi:3-hydroxyisobutyrate dehydrogenase-like beta-hydroxyacid dehydrogenase